MAVQMGKGGPWPRTASIVFFDWDVFQSRIHQHVGRIRQRTGVGGRLSPLGTRTSKSALPSATA
jgi:hypothetical protein